MGIGMATVQNEVGHAALEVGNCHGVRIAGIMFQSGPVPADGSVVESLIRIGNKYTDITPTALNETHGDCSGTVMSFKRTRRLAMANGALVEEKWCKSFTSQYDNPVVLNDVF